MRCPSRVGRVRWLLAVCMVGLAVGSRTAHGSPTLPSGTHHTSRRLINPCQSADSAITLTPCDTTVSLPADSTLQVSWSLQDLHYAFPDSIVYHVSCSITFGAGTTINSCSGPSGSISVGIIKNVSLQVTTGSVTGTGGIQVYFISDSPADTVIVGLGINNGSLALSLPFQHNYDQNTALCANSCFAGTAAVSTVPYYTFDTPRSVTLVYNSDHLSPRPFVYTDVTFQGPGSPPTQYWFQVKDTTGAALPFINGETTLHFTGTSGTVRLAGQLALPSVQTSLDSVTYVVTAEYPDRTETSTIGGRLMIENDRASPIAMGWTIAGVQHAYPTAVGSFVTNGDGTMEGFGQSVTPGDPSQTSGLGVHGGYERTYPTGLQVWFNGQGQMISSVTSYGDTTHYTYTGGKPTTIGEFQRGGWTLGYGTYGLATITEPNLPGGGSGRVTRFVVAADSTLTSVEDPDGGMTHFGYDGDKRLSYIVDRRGDTTRLGYDTTWKVTSVHAPSVPVDVGGGSTTNQIPVTTYRAWQGVGVPIGPTASSPATPMVPDSMVAVITDPAGHPTRFTVDPWGEALVVTNAFGGTNTGYCDSTCVFADSIKNAAGGVNRYTYTWPGLTSVQTAGGATVHIINDLTYTQTPDSIYGGGVPSQRRFIGAQGEVDSIRVNGYTFLFLTGGRMYRYTYDSHGRLTSASDPGGHLTSYYYDAVFGNLDSVVTPGHRVAVKRFDSYGRDSAVRATGTPWQSVVYDVMNRPTHVYDGVNATPTLFTYDALYLTRVEDPQSQVYRYGVDALGRVAYEYDPADTVGLYQSYRFSVDGMLTGYTNRRGQAITYTYDALHRLTRKSGTNVVSASFSYDTVGLRTVMSNAVETDIIVSDSTGWVTSVTADLGGQSFGRVFQHDSALRLTSSYMSTTTSIPFVTRHLGYDHLVGTLDTLSLNLHPGWRSVFAYDSIFRHTATTYPSNLVESDSSTALSQQYRVDFHGNTAIDNALNLKFGFDSLGQANNFVYVTSGGTMWGNTQYNYDSLGRLASVSPQTITPANFATTCPSDTTGGFQCTRVTGGDTLEYDAMGNFSGGKLGGSSVTGTVTTGNRETAWRGVSHTFDADGNVITSGSRTFYWSADGLLDSVVAGTTTLHYEYNAAGQLVKKSRNGTATSYFLWDGQQLAAELNGSATSRTAEYVYASGAADVPFAVEWGSGALSYYRQDHVLGNVAGLVRSDSGGSATLQEQYTYDEFGVPTTVVDSLSGANRLQWKGAFYEGDSARLYYLRARWYDPEQGRFMSEDPLGFLGGGLNMYQFAAGDPVNGSDPSGACTFEYVGSDVPQYASEGALEPDAQGVTYVCTGDDPDAPWAPWLGVLPGTTTYGSPGYGDGGCPVIACDGLDGPSVPMLVGVPDIGGGGATGSGGGSGSKPTFQKQVLPKNALACNAIGQSFYAPPTFNIAKIAAAGSAGGYFNIFAMRAAVAQYGTFDFQRVRDPAGNTTFYTGYTPVSNMAVGAYLYGAGYGLAAAGWLSNLYASLHSSNAGDPHQEQFRDLGYLAAAGVGGVSCSAP